MAGLPSGLVAPLPGRSLCDVLVSAAAATGAGSEENRLGLPPARHYVVLLVDGLGARALERHADLAPVLTSLWQQPLSETITAGVPSTTSTSLTSLGTGRRVGEHGMAGYFFRHVDDGGRATMLPTLDWPRGVDPVRVQPTSTVFERAGDAGVRCRVVAAGTFRGSGLSTASMRGGRYVSTATLGQRAAAAAAVGEGPSLTYVYEPDLDKTGHRNGLDSPAWRAQLAVLDRFVDVLLAGLPRDAVLVVTGDHGMVDVAREEWLDVESDPALLRDVQMIGGDARFRHVYLDPDAAREPDRVDGVVSRWRDRVEDGAWVVPRREAIASGVFGPVTPSMADRLGDVVVATRRTALAVPSLAPRESMLVGMHGSLTPEEMLVPLVVAG